jgi:RNA polymerase sigma-70 factor (ECF subfamily)
MQPAQAPGSGVRRELDPESREWLSDLRSEGSPYDAAVERLYELLLRAARFEANRRAPWLASVDRSEIDQIVSDSAGDALVSVLGHLDDFRGLSKFTTWAYKFAILETAVKLRRRAWRDREIPREPERWELVQDLRHMPEDDAEQSELLAALGNAIENALTPRQREVLVAVAVNGVPIDVLAERLESTRGALYKTLHDARRKLRATLAAAGFDVGAELGGIS